MECEWEPEPQDLGALGIAGICRETSLVLRRAVLPNCADFGPPLLKLANIAACSALSSHVASDLDNGLLRLFADLAGTFLLGLWLLSTVTYVLLVASLYRTGMGDDLLTAECVLKAGPLIVRLKRLLFTFLLVAVTLIVVSTKVPRAGLLGWASVAYLAVVGQLACVVSVLEDAAHFSAVRRSREILTGKFWPAACVFITLDGCIIAVLKAFPVLVVDDVLGLGLAFQLASGAAMFVALSAVLVVTLVAQPVVYIVCKSHHQGVVDKAHLA